MAFKKSAPKTAPKTGQNTTTRKEPVRQAITLEAVVARAPHSGLAENLSRTFGLDCPEYAAIREGTEEHVVRSANVLRDDLNDKAMEIHLQRIVGSFVSSAFGASTFYQTKVTTAKDLTMASQNDARDGVSGFMSKAENARLFAAGMGLQAYALMAAAEGAVHAYPRCFRHICPTAAVPLLSRQSGQADVDRAARDPPLSTRLETAKSSPRASSLCGRRGASSYAPETLSMVQVAQH